MIQKGQQWNLYQQELTSKKIRKNRDIKHYFLKGDKEYSKICVNNGVHNLQGSLYIAKHSETQDFGMILLKQQEFKYLDNLNSRIEQISNLIIQAINISMMYISSSSSPIPGSIDKSDQIVMHPYQTRNNINMEELNKDITHSNQIQNTKQNIDFPTPTLSNSHIDINQQQQQYQLNSRKITINQPVIQSNYNFKLANQSQQIQNLQCSNITDGYPRSLNRIPPVQYTQAIHSNQPNQKDVHPWLNNIQQTVTDYYQLSKINKFYNEKVTSNIQGSGQAQPQQEIYFNTFNQQFSLNSYLLKARLMLYIIRNDIKEYQLSCREQSLSDYKKYRVKWFEYEQKYRNDYEKSLMSKIQSDRVANQKYLQFQQQIQNIQQQSYQLLTKQGNLCYLTNQNFFDINFIDSVIGNDIQAYSMNQKKQGVYSSTVSKIEDLYQQRTIIINIGILLENLSKVLSDGEKVLIYLDQYNYIDPSLLSDKEKVKLLEAYGETIIDENSDRSHAQNQKTQNTGVFLNQNPHNMSNPIPQFQQSKRDKTNFTFDEEDLETFRDMILSIIQQIYSMYKDNSSSISIQVHRFYSKYGIFNPELQYRKRYLNEIIKANIQMQQKQNPKQNQLTNNAQNIHSNQTQPSPYSIQVNKNNNNNFVVQKTLSGLPQARPSILIPNGQNFFNISNANAHSIKTSPTKAQKNQSNEMVEKILEQQQLQETLRNNQQNQQNFQGHTQCSEETTENNQSFNNSTFPQNNQSNHLNTLQTCNQNNQSSNQNNQQNIQYTQSFNNQNIQTFHQSNQLFNQITIINNNNSQQINHQNFFNSNTISTAKKNQILNMTEQVSQTMSNNSNYQNMTGQIQEKTLGYPQQQHPQNNFNQQNTIKNYNYEKSMSDINQQSLIQSGAIQQLDQKNNLNPLFGQTIEQSTHYNKQETGENYVVNTQYVEELIDSCKYRKLRVVRVNIEIQQNLTSEHQTSDYDKNTNFLSQIQEYVQYLSPLPLIYNRQQKEYYVIHCYTFYVENFIYTKKSQSYYKNDSISVQLQNNEMNKQNELRQNEFQNNNLVEENDAESISSIDNKHKDIKNQKKYTLSNLDIITEQNAKDEFNNGSDTSRKSKKLHQFNFIQNQIKDNNSMLKRLSTSKVSPSSRGNLNLDCNLSYQQSHQNSFAIRNQRSQENILEFNQEKKLDEDLNLEQQLDSYRQQIIRPQQISFNGKFNETLSPFYNDQTNLDNTRYDILNKDTDRKNLSAANLINNSVNYDKSSQGLFSDRYNIEEPITIERRISENLKLTRREDNTPRPNKSKSIDTKNFQKYPSGDFETFPSNKMLNSMTNDELQVRQQEKFRTREREFSTDMFVNQVRQSDTQMHNHILQKYSQQNHNFAYNIRVQDSRNMYSSQQVQDDISETSEQECRKYIEDERNDKELTMIQERSEINNSICNTINYKNLLHRIQSSKTQDNVSNQQSVLNHRSSNVQSQLLSDDVLKQNYSKIHIQSQNIVQNSQTKDLNQESQIVGKSLLHQNIQHSNYQHINSLAQVGNNISSITNHLIQNFEIKFNKDEQGNKDIFISQKMN